MEGSRGGQLEEENEENVGDELEESMEEMAVEADVKCLLWTPTIHQGTISISTFFLTFGEPLLKAPNSQLRAFKERFQGKSEGSPPY